MIRVARWFIGALFVCFLGCVGARAQTSTFSLTASPIALPAGGHTVAGSISGFTFAPTPNFELREDNLIVSGPAAVPGNAMGFYGGFSYYLPVLSTKLNNASPNVNGFRFRFHLTASFGVDRYGDSAGNTLQHYSALAGGGAEYDLTGSGKWSMAVEIRAARLPGIANGWTTVVSLGPALHF